MTVQEIIDLAWSWLDDPEVPHRWPLVEMVALLDKTVNEFLGKDKFRAALLTRSQILINNNKATKKEILKKLRKIYTDA